MVAPRPLPAPVTSADFIAAEVRGSSLQSTWNDKPARLKFGRCAACPTCSRRIGAEPPGSIVDEGSTGTAHGAQDSGRDQRGKQNGHSSEQPARAFPGARSHFVLDE